MKLNKKAILSTLGAGLVIAVALVGCGSHKNAQKTNTQPKNNATSQAFKENKDKNQNKSNEGNNDNSKKGKPNMKNTGKTKKPKALKNAKQKKPVLKTKHSVVKNNLKNQKQTKKNKQVIKPKTNKATKNPNTKIVAQKNVKAYQYINNYTKTPQGRQMVAKTNLNRKKHMANVYLQPKFINQFKSLDKQCKNLPKRNKNNVKNAKVAQANKNQSQHLLAQATKLNKEINNTLLYVNNKQAKGLKLRVANGNGKSLAQINKHGLNLQHNIQNIYKHDVQKLLALNKGKINPALKRNQRSKQASK